MLRVGIDTGGTFTDFIWVNEAGQVIIHKEPSTPTDPSRSILRGLDRLGIPLTTNIVHGSTVATNALLERHGARTALITTCGFGDVLEIGRQNRNDLYALVPTKEPPLVPFDLRYEAEERITSSGEVLVPLDSAEIERLAARMVEDEIDSVAVCLLFSYLRPDHEQQLGAVLRAVSGDERALHVSLSTEVLPEYREYERTATTVINAYVAPLMTHYLSRLADGVAPRTLAVMQSNGGIIGAALAGEQAARTVLSGPAGGVVGARAAAAESQELNGANIVNLITFDMGGTSTDVALCPGRLPMTSESEIAGLPLRLPVVDIHTVGAGGGSLAYVDAGGALHTGPESAGAEPGPACYQDSYQSWRSLLDQRFPSGLATVTDANLLLGRIRVDHFLGGSRLLNIEASRKALSAVAAKIAAETPEEAAKDILRVANATMERAIRRISVERGFDPRSFTLLAFGGGGPLHACDLAASLKISRVLIPRTPGVLSALGMLIAVPSRDYSQTLLHRILPDAALPTAWLLEQFQPLMARALVDMTADGYSTGDISWQYQMDLRYVGQSHEITVTWSPLEADGSFVSAFHNAHEQRYSYQHAESAVELVTLRLTATVSTASAPSLVPGSGENAPSASQTGIVWFNSQPVTTLIFARDVLVPGSQFMGPAIVTQYDTTTVVPPLWHGHTDEAGNLHLTLGHAP